ncbi:hypothetical protein [Enterobacter cloacae]|uniref:hypothetical protein n=1 Tax=Enterobacter cloacae TaxID=550 RepID=UPI0034CF7E3F
MKFTKKLEFGNYTLKFGSENVLLDYIDEIVTPSFSERKYIRHIGDKTDFFFIDTKMVVLDDNKTKPVLGICGRIIKNTVLTRDQVFEGNTLLEDYEELDTAPSSFFLLILNNHRLIFCKEVSGAPTIENFQSTSQYCLMESWTEYINNQFEENKSSRKKNPKIKRLTKKSLKNDCPSPKLRITTLTDKETLEEFIDSFEEINRLSIKLLPTNKEEIDNDDFFWQTFGDKSSGIDSENTRVIFSNPTDGLNQAKVFSELESATSLANSNFSVKGYDENGDIRQGNNNDFSLLVELSDLSKDVDDATETAYEEFKKLVANDRICIPRKTENNARRIIKSLFRRLQ